MKTMEKLIYNDALLEALQNDDFVKSYDKLTGSSMQECKQSILNKGLNFMIDMATGRISEELRKFNIFFFEYVWTRI